MVERHTANARALRSKKGCPECRARKIKCDEKVPRCTPCVKTQRVCHLQDSVFKQHKSTGDSPLSSGESPASQASTHQTQHTSPSGWQSSAHQYPKLHAVPLPPSQNNPRSAPVELSGKDLRCTQEELFLLRHYCSYLARWMDHLYRFEVFSRSVLVLAREHNMLRFAACSVAAKQLSQVNGELPKAAYSDTQERIAASIKSGPYGFAWYSAKYYELAIQTLTRSISRSDDHIVTLSDGELMIYADQEDPIVRLLGTCMLIQYEHLDANRHAWSGHLTGFSKLLELIDGGRILQSHPDFEQVYPWTRDIMSVKACFWNFIVNDLEETFISRRRPRIDTKNLALWRNMGLFVEDDGAISLLSARQALITSAEHAQEKVLTYTLIWYLYKLIDLIAVPETTPASAMIPPTTTAAHDGEFAWLEQRFDEWFTLLTPAFHPDGKFKSAASDDSTSKQRVYEMWYCQDLSATTMLYYNMARILLLIHQPPNRLLQSSSDLLNAFREVENKLYEHGSDILAIARGTLCDDVKLRAIQPLYVAGRCLKDDCDRGAVIDLLASIQARLGVATKYRADDLAREWGTSSQNGTPQS